jgi:hypothetical protein
MYAMCIVRAVNGLVESSQQGYFAASILTLANKIGLPSWFVDLRHDSTHNILPSINLLRSASRSLLQWCRETYWDQQNIYLENLSYRCLHFSNLQDNNLTKEIIENSNGFDLLFTQESTFLSNILLPLFHDHHRNSFFVDQLDGNLLTLLLQQQQQGEEGEGKEITQNSSFDFYQNHFSQIKEVWELLFLKAITSHKGAIHLILSSLFSTLLNEIISQRKAIPQGAGAGGEIQHFYYFILNWWGQEISEKYLELIGTEGNENGNSDMTRVISPPVSIRRDWQRYQKFPDNEKKFLELMNSTLEKLYGINSLQQSDLVEKLLDGPDHHAADLTVEESILKNSKKRKILESFPLCSGGEGQTKNEQSQRRKRLWPLGNQIGDLSSCYLHLLEEIN